MELRVLTSLEELEQHKQAWNDLAASAEYSNYFLTFEFFHSFCTGFTCHELHTLLLSENKQLVGILPAYKENNTLHYLGSLDVSDYGDVISTAGHKEAVLAQIAEYCTEHTLQLSLLSIPEGSSTRQLAAHLFSNTTETQQEVCPQFENPATYEEYLSNLKRKQRHEARRKMKKLREDHAYTIRLVATDLQDSDVETFTMLHQSSSSEKAEFWTAEKSAFFCSLMKESSTTDHLRLFFLEIENKPVAAMLGFEYADRFHLYNAGYLSDEFPGYSTGQVALLETIKWSIEHQLKTFDFLRGDEEYKFRLGGVSHPIYDIVAT